jgi:hypothetical protein
MARMCFTLAVAGTEYQIIKAMKILKNNWEYQVYIRGSFNK